MSVAMSAVGGRERVEESSTRNVWCDQFARPLRSGPGPEALPVKAAYTCSSVWPSTGDWKGAVGSREAPTISVLELRVGRMTKAIPPPSAWIGRRELERR
jgi:hypothetical protein